MCPPIVATGKDDSVFDGIRTELVQVILKAMAEGVEDTYQLQQTIRRTVGRWVNRTHRRRPMIIPVVIEA